MYIVYHPVPRPEQFTSTAFGLTGTELGRRTSRTLGGLVHNFSELKFRSKQACLTVDSKCEAFPTLTYG